MIINIGNYEFTELWDGVYYKALSDFPKVSDWEIKNIIDFIQYDRAYGRETQIQSEHKEIAQYIQQELLHREKYADIQRPEKITECMACRHGGCLTRFLCHTAPVENAVKIMESGKLLSAVNARQCSEIELQKESRNAAKDPVDFFHYVMLSWGNCQAGDRLVMERKKNRFPTEEDLSINFTPGVRFYFEYETIVKHPNAVQDGVHPMKIKEEICLKDYVYAIIIPSEYKERFDKSIPDGFLQKVYYLDRAGEDLWGWSEKVYGFVEGIKQGNKV